MCGIIAIVRRRTSRVAPDTKALAEDLKAASAQFPEPQAPSLATDLGQVGAALEAIDHQLRGEAGLRALIADSAFVQHVEAVLEELNQKLEKVEGYLEVKGDEIPGLEEVNGAIVVV